MNLFVDCSVTAISKIFVKTCTLKSRYSRTRNNSYCNQSPETIPTPPSRPQSVNANFAISQVTNTQQRTPLPPTDPRYECKF